MQALLWLHEYQSQTIVRAATIQLVENNLTHWWKSQRSSTHSIYDNWLRLLFENKIIIILIIVSKKENIDDWLQKKNMLTGHTEKNFGVFWCLFLCVLLHSAHIFGFKSVASQDLFERLSNFVMGSVSC